MSQYDEDSFQEGWYQASISIRDAIKLSIENYENSKAWEGLQYALDLIEEDFLK